jgi:hypothetical protein
MATDNGDKVDPVVVLVSGALIGVAAALLFVRMRRKRALGSNANHEDYYYDGGDLFV